MNPKLKIEDVRQLLNRSATTLDAPTVAKLRRVRESALERFEARQAVPAFAFAGAGEFVAGQGNKTFRWAMILLLTISLFGAVGYYWQQASEHDSGDDVDIAILTDDLPMDAYVD